MIKFQQIQWRFLLAFIFLFSHLIVAFTQNLIWQKCLGGGIGEIFYTAAPTADGGAIIVGDSHSEDEDLENVPQDQGNGVWLVKLSSNQTIEWQKRFGSTSDDEARSIIQTQDGAIW